MSTTETAPSIPFALPRDAKPSELVRSLAPEHWGCGAYKRVFPDGRIEWCASGIMCEHLGSIRPDPLSGEYVIERDTFTSMLLLLGDGNVVRGHDRLTYLINTNDHYGQGAAADLLESWGL